MLYDSGLARKIIRPSQNGLHLGCKHVKVKRFRYKIIAAHVHCHYDIHIVRGRGNKNYRHLGHSANFSAPVIAIKKRQRNIHKDELRIKIRKLLHNVSKILCTPSIKSPCFYMLFYSRRYGFVVFDN